jgi:hypothetical protein
LALFGRRSPQRVDSLVMPASENLHNTGHTGPCCCMSADGRILLNQKRLCVDLVHEDEWDSMRCFRVLSQR